MEDKTEQTPSADFVRGYNEGYILAKEMPDLAAKLEGALTGSDRALGFKEGKAQWDYELERDRAPAWMNRYGKEGHQEKDFGDKSPPKEDREPDKD